MMQSNLAQATIDVVKYKVDLTPEEEEALRNELESIEKDFDSAIAKNLEWAEKNIKYSTRKYDIYTDKIIKKALENLAKSYY